MKTSRWLYLLFGTLAVLVTAQVAADTFVRPEEPRASNAGWLQGPHPIGTAPFTNPQVLGAKGVDGGMEYLRSTGGALNVTGTSSVTAPDGGLPVTGPLTDTQLRATPVPVSGTVTVSGGTDIDSELDLVYERLHDVQGHDYMSATPGVTIPTTQAVYPARAIAITSSECIAVIAANGTTCPAMPAGTYMASMQQRGPNDAVCTVGGTVPTLSNGIRMAGQGAAVTDPTDGFGPFPVTNANTNIKCITRTADQVAGAAVEITYWSH